MALAALLDPISDDNPCGPDLEQQDDEGFLDYYFEAEARLPERYFTPGTAPDGRDDRLFDPRSVDLAAERGTIMGLLEKSRDLRLMSLLARFQILAGRLPDFADTVETIAAVMAEWPTDVHPRLDAGSADRRAAIEALNSQPTVVMPLLHLPLVPNSDTTLRRHMVAIGRADMRGSESDLAGSDQLSPLRSEANGPVVTQLHANLGRIADALHRIGMLASSHPAKAFTPDLGAVRTAVGDLQAMIAAARPELQPWSREDAANTAAPPVAAPEPDGTTTETAPMPQVAPVTAAGNAPTIGDRASAAAALDAALEWMVANEPSSPALVLAQQARQLVGASLVEAMEALLPERAGKAILRIGHGSPFSLPMERLKSLTKTGLERGEAGENPPSSLPKITARGQIVSYFLAVEGYFQSHEPASPIPLLLIKAREMLSKRFDIILAELLVAPDKED